MMRELTRGRSGFARRSYTEVVMRRSMILSSLCLTTVCALQFGNPLGVLAQAAGSTLFEGARVIVGDESAAIENAAILVENGRITAVGRSGEVRAPAGAARVDL